MPQGRRTVAEILTLSIPLSAKEATAIVRQLCGSVPAEAGEAAIARLAPEHVWLDRSGNVHLSPGVVASVADVGALLERLLTAVRRHERAHIPPGLVLLAALAAGRLDSAPFASLAPLATALARFDSRDPNATLRALFAAADDQLTRQQRAPSSAQQHAPDAAGTIADHEYQEPLYGARTLIGERSATQRDRPQLRRVVAALTIAGLVAGIATALILQLPRDAADSPRGRADVRVEMIDVRVETIDVPVEPSSTITNAPIDPLPPTTPSRSVNPRAGEKSQRPGVVSVVPAARRPQPLFDQDQIHADAIFSPSFAADGTALLFQAESASGSTLKRAERGDHGILHVVTIVDDGAKNYHVKLSPDGRSVAFDSDRDGVRGVYVARADGSDVRRVSGSGYAAVPTWSPDGRRLAFLRAEDTRPTVWNLWLLDLDSGETARLTNYRYGQVWAGAWFPEGRRIAYSHEDRLIVLDPNSGHSTTYVSPRRGRLVRTPAVSPDGRWIIFQVFRDGTWLLDLESGSMQRVLDDPSAEEFSWAPDGRRVAFHSRRSGKWMLWMMAPR